MGYDPEDKAKLQEMQKSAGKSYAISFVASLVSAFVPAASKDHPRYLGRHGDLWDESRLCRLAGLCDHGAIDGQPFRQSVNQALLDQYRLAVGLLSGDGQILATWPQ